MKRRSPEDSWSSATIPNDPIAGLMCHYTIVKEQRMYSSRSEPSRKSPALGTWGDNDVSVLVH